MIVGLALAGFATAAGAQAPIGGQPRPIPTSTPAPPTGALPPPPTPPPAQPQPPPVGQPPQTGQPPPAGQPQPGQPTAPGLPPPTPTTPGTATPTWTPIPTWTPLPTPTVTSTPTPSPYPTFVPQLTPTLAWPTPAPGAFFRSRYLAAAPDPSIPPGTGAGSLRGRVLDWRGIGIDRFRVQATKDGAATLVADTLGDGQYTFLILAPGSYQIVLPDYPSEPARGVPVLGGRVTTLDWQESNRIESAPAPVGSVSATAIALPSRTATPVPAALVQRPPSSPARPPPLEVVALGIVARAAETLVNAFLTGAAVVAVAAALTIAVIRWRSRSPG